jgi:hypothetical protein
MGDSYDDRGVTYIGPRALLVGLLLYCAGFMALIYGANRISESYEARESAVAGNGAFALLATAVPAGPQPLRSAVHAPAREHAGSPSLICAPAPPCAVRPAHKAQPAAKSAATVPALPVPGVPRSVAPAPAAPASVVPVPPRSIPPAARPATHPLTVPPVERRESAPAPVVPRSTTPPVQAARTPAARARQTPAPLLVPFTSASGLTSNGSLDPRSGSHAPLMVGPTRGLGPNPAAAPFGGTSGSQPR